MGKLKRLVSKLRCLPSKKTLEKSIELAQYEYGSSGPGNVPLSRRVIKKSLEKYFNFRIDHLTTLLMEFIHQQASLGAITRDLDPYKQLLWVANNGNATKDEIYVLIDGMKYGPLSDQWNKLLARDLINDVQRYDEALEHGIPREEINTPYLMPPPPDSDYDASALLSFAAAGEYNPPPPPPPRTLHNLGIPNIPSLVLTDDFGDPIPETVAIVTRPRRPRKPLDHSYDAKMFLNASTSTFVPNPADTIDSSYRSYLGLNEREFSDTSINSDIYPSDIEFDTIIKAPPGY